MAPISSLILSCAIDVAAILAEVIYPLYIGIPTAAKTPMIATLISAGADRLVKFWDVETSQEKRTLKPQPDWVLALAVSADSKWVALGRYDGPVVFHEVQSHD